MLVLLCAFICAHSTSIKWTKVYFLVNFCLRAFASLPLYRKPLPPVEPGRQKVRMMSTHVHLKSRLGPVTNRHRISRRRTQVLHPFSPRSNRLGPCVRKRDLHEDMENIETDPAGKRLSIKKATREDCSGKTALLLCRSSLAPSSPETCVYISLQLRNKIKEPTKA